MASNLQARRNGGRRAYRPMSEINVTPMVDVMLVLLIVFMVAAPLLTVGVPVELPKNNAPALNENKEPLQITINADGDVFIGEQTKVEVDDLAEKLKAITNNNPDAVIYLRGDKGVAYGRVSDVMALISSAGFTKISLVSELPPTGRRP
jgi:biopolymer transport protein TolR